MSLIESKSKGSKHGVGMDLVCEEMEELVQRMKVFEVVEEILNRLHCLLLPLSTLLVERCVHMIAFSISSN